MIQNERGLTLIETLVAMAILLFASICAFSFFSLGLGAIHREGDRRAAVEVARSRMEQLMESGTAGLKPPDANAYGVSCSGSPCAWSLQATPQPETVLVNDQSRQMVTTVQWIDDPASVGTQNILLFSVKVWYQGNAVDNDFSRVELRSLRAP